MELIRAAPGLFTGPQVEPHDMAELAARGIRGIICNRPDGEGEDQPLYAEIEKAARAHGIDTRYVPVTPGQMTEADVAAFGAALDALPGPVLAFCRTGARAAALWSRHSGQTPPAAT